VARRLTLTVAREPEEGRRDAGGLCFLAPIVPHLRRGGRHRTTVTSHRCSENETSGHRCPTVYSMGHLRNARGCQLIPEGAFNVKSLRRRRSPFWVAEIGAPGFTWRRTWTRP
jgi:hypothetical protein